jgi:hypothetical protein
MIAWPDGRRDDTTEVRWLQGLCAYADLRRPSPIADFSHVYVAPTYRWMSVHGLLDSKGLRAISPSTAAISNGHVRSTCNPKPRARMRARSKKPVGTHARLLRVGGAFMFARDRAAPLPGYQTLGECVAAAGTAQHAQALVDCEISFGIVTRRNATLSQLISVAIGSARKDNPDMQRPAKASGTRA